MLDDVARRLARAVDVENVDAGFGRLAMQHYVVEAAYLVDFVFVFWLRVLLANGTHRQSVDRCVA